MLAAANLELVQVTKRYGATLAVDGINLRVPAGSYCCLLVPSGCGKTSTLRMIAGHESVSEGDILIGPANVTKLRPSLRYTLGRRRKLAAEISIRAVRYHVPLIQF